MLSNEIYKPINHIRIVTAASLFDWESPLEEDLIWDNDENLREGKVIGVIEDFHFQSLHSSIAPLIIQLNPEKGGHGRGL